MGISEQTDNRNVFKRYHETDFHGNRVEISEDNMGWLATEGEQADNVVRLERVRRENPEEYLAVMAGVQNDVKGRILAALVDFGGLTYQDLEEIVANKTLRTVKSHVMELRDDGVVEVSDGRPSLIDFSCPAVRLLATDAVNYFFSF